MKKTTPSFLSRSLTTALKVGLAVGLITYMVKSGHLDLAELWTLLTPLNIAIGLFLAGINIGLAAWRWILLLKARGFKIPLKYGFSLYLIGIFFNHALPGAVGGDLVRGYYLMNDYPQRRVDAVLSILIDRALGLYSFFLLALIAVVFDWNYIMKLDQMRWLTWMCLIIFFAMTTFFLITFSRRLTRLVGMNYLMKRIKILEKMVDAFHRFGQDRQSIALSVVVSLLAQVFTLIFFYQLAHLSGEEGVTWKAVMFAVPMGFVATALPISPAGVGVGQVAFLFLFKTYLNSNTTFGATAITAFQLSLACWALVGAVFYLRRRKPHDLSRMSKVRLE